MKRILLCSMMILLSACQSQQAPQYGNATVYTTPGSPGGVSASKYEVTPL